MFCSARSFVVSGGLPLLVIFCSPVQLNAASPRITALSPISGAVGASVTITGLILVLPKVLARIIHEFEDKRSLLCYKHVV